jgi:hypothetical protein
MLGLQDNYTQNLQYLLFQKWKVLKEAGVLYYRGPHHLMMDLEIMVIRSI